MSAIRELVQVYANGGEWRDWTAISLKAAIDEAARAFTLTVPPGADNAVSARAAFAAGTKIEIRANGEKLFDGYVDAYAPRRRPDASEISVTGRSKSCDLVDCSIVHPTGRIRDSDLEKLARDLDRFGVGVKVEGEKVPVVRFQATPGETVFRALERETRKRGLTISGEADGSVRISKGPTGKRHAFGLFEGVNILESEAKHDWSKRFSEYKVRAQSPDGTGDEATRIEESAKDSAVGRPRPNILAADEDMDKAAARIRADWRKDRAAGESLTATIVTAGWRDQDGTIWTPGHLVWVESQFLDIAQDMLIKSVQYDQSKDAGSTCSLSLVDPRAFGGKKGKVAKSGKGWEIGE